MTTLNDDLTNDSNASPHAEPVQAANSASRASATAQTPPADSAITQDTPVIQSSADFSTPDDALNTEEFASTTITASTSATDPASSEQDLLSFEQEINTILATGALDETLRVIDAEGVAQVLPVLDSEPIAHLLDGLEEIGGKGNVFVRTSRGIAVLSVMEYSPEDQPWNSAELEEHIKETAETTVDNNADTDNTGETFSATVTAFTDTASDTANSDQAGDTDEQ
ncbi:hypothetical protein [Bifidobacterium gallicum]|uniref:Uncharacterized protein n=1 Tax=Bifidobacterium gallicum DSM 20093 = LMG 11596 TaxID=561180 RepID=A0A087AJY2_9BIFI|nr:hypothetical protein BGLCM_0666 [Bifidobacterium gallicum DSM 20093 = LMG 11596]